MCVCVCVFDVLHILCLCTCVTNCTCPCACRDREELLTALCNARDLTHSLVEVGSDWEVMQEADSDLGQQVQGLIRRVDTLPRLETPLASITLDGEAARGVSHHLQQLSLSVTLSSPIPTTPHHRVPPGHWRRPPALRFPCPAAATDTEAAEAHQDAHGAGKLKEKPEIWDLAVLPEGPADPGGRGQLVSEGL